MQEIAAGPLLRQHSPHANTAINRKTADTTEVPRDARKLEHLEEGIVHVLVLFKSGKTMSHPSYLMLVHSFLLVYPCNLSVIHHQNQTNKVISFRTNLEITNFGFKETET
jgi:hypothetical protein